MTQGFRDVREVAAYLGWTPKMVDDAADAANVPRSMDRRQIAVQPFLEYVAARSAAGKQAAANVRAMYHWPFGPDTPLIVTGLVPSRDHVHRGAKTGTGNVIEYTDGNGRRVISRRDFFAGE